MAPNLRVGKEFKAYRRDVPDGIACAMNENDQNHWTAFIQGPEDSEYESGIFKLDIVFPDNYPSYPPKIKFITDVFHPNIYANGEICLDILQGNWSSSYSIVSVLMSIRSLLTDPNVKSPANAKAANYYSNDRTAFYNEVRSCVEKSLEQDFTF